MGFTSADHVSMKLPPLANDLESKRLNKKGGDDNEDKVVVQPQAMPRSGLYRKKRECSKGKCAAIGIVLGAAAATGIAIYSNILTPCHHVTIQSHPVLQPWLDEAMKVVQGTTLRMSDGNCVEATTCYTDSARSESPCGEKGVPHLWITPNEYWIRKDNADLAADGTSPFVKNIADCKSLAQVPIGLAMYRTVAEGLGWPNDAISVADIENLIDNGLDSITVPAALGTDFGMVAGRLPTSNAALQFYTEALLLWNGKTTAQGISVADAESAATAAGVRKISSAVEHRDILNEDALNVLLDESVNYVQAAPAYETDVFTANQGKLKSKSEKLVMVYPSTGVSIQNFPMCVINGENKEGITEYEIEGAEILSKFLLGEQIQNLAPKYGVRPAAVKLSDTPDYEDFFQLANGLISVIPVPTMNATTDIAVANKLAEVWKAEKKPTVWSLVLDTSGSIVSRKTDILDAVDAFVGNLQDFDLLNVYLFNDDVTRSVFNQTVAEVKGSVRSTIDGHVFGGNNALYDGIIAALDDMDAIRGEDLSADLRRSYGIVVLNDGPNDRGTATAGAVSARVRDTTFNARLYHIYTVLFGDVDSSTKSSLSKISESTRGAQFDVAKVDKRLVTTFKSVSLKL